MPDGIMAFIWMGDFGVILGSNKTWESRVADDVTYRRERAAAEMSPEQVYVFTIAGMDVGPVNLDKVIDFIHAASQPVEQRVAFWLYGYALDHLSCDGDAKTRLQAAIGDLLVA